MATNETDVQPTRTAGTPKGKSPEKPQRGTPYPGIDGKTGVRFSVTLEGLKQEFGDERGWEIYRDIGIAGGFGDPTAGARSRSFPSFDIQSLRDVAKDTSADDASREDAKTRLAEIDSILSGTE
jgi:hypothetical protein